MGDVGDAEEDRMKDRTGQVWIVRPNGNKNDHWIFVVTGPSVRPLRTSFHRHPILCIQGSSNDVLVTDNGETIGSDACWEENDIYTRIA